MTGDLVKIVVVDDDVAVREGLEALLFSAGYEAELFGSAEAFLEAPEALDGASCMLVDVRMPGIDGLQLLDRLTTQSVTVPVIIMTGHGDVQMAVKAMREGASDFVEKPFTRDEIMASIERAISKPIRPNVALGPEHLDLADRIGSLSQREREVLDQLVKGESNKTIAFNLGISPRTVEVHRAHLMDKMRAKSVADLVRMAVIAEIAGASKPGFGA